MEDVKTVGIKELYPELKMLATDTRLKQNTVLPDLQLDIDCLFTGKARD